MSGKVNRKELKSKRALQEKMARYGIPDIEMRFEEYKNKISIYKDREPIDKKLLKKSKMSEEEYLFEQFIDEYGLREQVNSNIEHNSIRIVRKEILSKTSLYNLSLFNKVKMTLMEYNRYTGRSAKKQQEKERKLQEEKIKVESHLLHKLKEIINSHLDAKEFFISIKLQDKYIQYLSNVLNSEYFRQFEEVAEIEKNPNYLAYKVEMPILIFIKRKEAELEV